jgi:hypothetical protein
MGKLLSGRSLSTGRHKFAASYYPARRKPLWSAAARRRFSYWNTAARIHKVITGRAIPAPCTYSGFQLRMLSTDRGNSASTNKAPHPSPLPEGRGRKRLPLCYLVAYLWRPVLTYRSTLISSDAFLLQPAASSASFL